MFQDAIDDYSFAPFCAPIIDSFTPTRGKVGTTVSISGLNLSTAYMITFNGKAQLFFTSLTSVGVKVKVPSGATSGRIKVATFGGSAQSSSNFTVTQ